MNAEYRYNNSIDNMRRLFSFRVYMVIVEGEEK